MNFFVYLFFIFCFLGGNIFSLYVLRSVWILFILLKTYCWKHCSKIIFKRQNIVHAFFTSWLVHEQCRETSQKKHKMCKTPQTNTRLLFLSIKVRTSQNSKYYDVHLLCKSIDFDMNGNNTVFKKFLTFMRCIKGVSVTVHLCPL